MIEDIGCHPAQPADFVDDLPGVPPFSVKSGLNLEPISANGGGGDRAWFYIATTASGTPGYRLTTLKALSGNLANLSLI